MIIKQLKLEVTSLCQNDCAMCAHGDLRKAKPEYELTLEQLNYFLTVSKASGYLFDNVRIHGPGEPLLWAFFNEGIKLMKESGIIKSIFVASNGLLLKTIEEDTWPLIDEMRISIYGNFKRHESLNKLKEMHPSKITITKVGTFRQLPVDFNEALIPCKCICEGPMLLGDVIYLYCGPPVFRVFNIALANNILFNDLIITPVERNWYAKYDINKQGNLSYCKFCWANKNNDLINAAHLTSGGQWS